MGTKTEMKICKGCGIEYSARTIILFKEEISLDGGYCVGCRNDMYESEIKKEEAIRLATLAGERRELRKHCGIPPKFMNEDFSTFLSKEQGNVNKIKQMCWDYAEKFPVQTPQRYRSIILLSPGLWGLGKSHLVCAIAHKLIDKWNGEDFRSPVHFITEPQLFSQIQGTYDKPLALRGIGDTEQLIIKRLLSVPLLILDDVGKEERSDSRFVQRILFSIIDGRYQNMLPIIITANKTIEGLVTHLGGDRGNEASAERLVEMCHDDIWEVTGKSHRFSNKVK